MVRRALAGEEGKLSLLGQSFGGFCILSYLSAHPQSLERVMITFGLAPIQRTAVEVYRATYDRIRKRNERFYRRYPGDVAKATPLPPPDTLWGDEKQESPPAGGL